MLHSPLFSGIFARSLDKPESLHTNMLQSKIPIYSLAP